jgi:hypothetical protein
MSSLRSDITIPGRPEVCEVSAGIYAYIQPDGTWWINNTGFLVGPQGVISIDSSPRAAAPRPTRTRSPRLPQRRCGLWSTPIIMATYFSPAALKNV